MNIMTSLTAPDPSMIQVPTVKPITKAADGFAVLSQEEKEEEVHRFSRTSRDPDFNSRKQPRDAMRTPKSWPATQPPSHMYAPPAASAVDASIFKALYLHGPVSTTFLLQQLTESDQLAITMAAPPNVSNVLEAYIRGSPFFEIVNGLVQQRTSPVLVTQIQPPSAMAPAFVPMYQQQNLVPGMSVAQHNTQHNMPPFPYGPSASPPSSIDDLAAALQAASFPTSAPASAQKIDPFAAPFVPGAVAAAAADAPVPFSGMEHLGPVAAPDGSMNAVAQMEDEIMEPDRLAETEASFVHDCDGYWVATLQYDTPIRLVSINGPEVESISGPEAEMLVMSDDVGLLFDTTSRPVAKYLADVPKVYCRFLFKDVKAVGCISVSALAELAQLTTPIFGAGAGLDAGQQQALVLRVYHAFAQSDARSNPRAMAFNLPDHPETTQATPGMPTSEIPIPGATPTMPETAEALDAAGAPETAEALDSAGAPEAAMSEAAALADALPDAAAMTAMAATDAGMMPETAETHEVAALLPGNTAMPEASATCETAATPRAAATPVVATLPATATTHEVAALPASSAIPETSVTHDTAAMSGAAALPEVVAMPEASAMHETAATSEVAATPEVAVTLSTVETAPLTDMAQAPSAYDAQAMPPAQKLTAEGQAVVSAEHATALSEAAAAKASLEMDLVSWCAARVALHVLVVSDLHSC